MHLKNVSFTPDFVTQRRESAGPGPLLAGPQPIRHRHLDGARPRHAMQLLPLGAAATQEAHRVGFLRPVSMRHRASLDAEYVEDARFSALAGCVGEPEGGPADFAPDGDRRVSRLLLPRRPERAGAGSLPQRARYAVPDAGALEPVRDAPAPHDAGWGQHVGVDEPPGGRQRHGEGSVRSQATRGQGPRARRHMQPDRRIAQGGRVRERRADGPRVHADTRGRPPLRARCEPGLPGPDGRARRRYRFES